MSLIALLIVLIIFGVILWLFNYLIPLDPKVKTVINVLLVLVLVIWLLRVLWVMPDFRI